MERGGREFVGGWGESWREGCMVDKWREGRCDWEDSWRERMGVSYMELGGMEYRKQIRAAHFVHHQQQLRGLNRWREVGLIGGG